MILKDADIQTAGLDARVLIKHVCGFSDADMISGDKDVPKEQAVQIEALAARRAAGEPISKILEQKEFWGLTFKVTPDTLSPRPDTEILIEAALKKTDKAQALRILDLGTGTGCIPIAFLTELPNARAVACDLSESALKIAQENAKTHGLQDRMIFIHSNWFEKIDGKFDLITSNPPYIPEQTRESLAPEVKNHDPDMALFAKKDGLQAYFDIFSKINAYMTPRAKAFFEIGYAQSEFVSRIAENNGLQLVGITLDIAGIPRVVEISAGEKE